MDLLRNRLDSVMNFEAQRFEKKKTIPSLQRWELMYRTAINQFEIIVNNMRYGVSSRI